ncbi:FadR family transcriptional regulator [Alcaligenaceae bacterium]|nr:FadR family transcriptional regulator [Alcaligenaceae bacterium]
MLKNRASLTDHVAGILIERILGGGYPIGSKLPAGRLLAQEFGVSAAVIREATERLRTKGLVRSRQGAGCVVLADTLDAGFQLDLPPAPDRSALRYIYELRVGLEGAAAALAAQRATAEDLARMAHILSRLKASLHVPAHALEWDFAFHRSLAEATHNPHYPQLLAYLSAQWRHSVAVARRHTFESGAAGQPGLAAGATEAAGATGAAEPVAAGLLRTQRVHEEHEAIFAAVQARDPQAARDRAQEHLRQACERLGLNASPSIPSTTPMGSRT